jgi:hypothetical protein
MWIRRHRSKRLEAGLRALRAEARADFVEDVAARILGPAPSRRAWSRLAFAAAVSAFVLGSFASFGGLSYAAPGVDGTVAAVKQIVVHHTLKVRVHTPSAAAQYPGAATVTPTTTTPTPKAAQTVKPFAPPTPSPASVPSGKTLPFTGISLLGTLVVSLALVGLGLVLRRRERRS